MSRDARFIISLCAILGVAIQAAGAETQLLRPSSVQIPGRIVLSSSQLPQFYRHETTNFIITNAPTVEIAREFGEAAETLRRELAILWLGQEMPNWSGKCPINVKVGNYGASGDTTFKFHYGEVYGWDMNVQGTRERILDSVLPHEISHTIFASDFRRPLPRWVDEGAATSVEHISERSNYRRLLLEYVDPAVRQAIPFNRMVQMQEYQEGNVLPLYSQCNSVAEFLIGQGGNRRFITFARDALDTNDWNAAVYKHYGYDNLGDLQIVWIRWVGEGFPNLSSYEPALIRNRRVQSIRQPVIPKFEPMIAGL